MPAHACVSHDRCQDSSFDKSLPMVLVPRAWTLGGCSPRRLRSCLRKQLVITFITQVGARREGMCDVQTTRRAGPFSQETASAGSHRHLLTGTHHRPGTVHMAFWLILTVTLPSISSQAQRQMRK